MAFGRDKYKSRILTRDELFDILQREFVVCELRMKIYPKEITNQTNTTMSPSQYWGDIAEKKKSKILNIAKKREILSMFDDDSIRSRIVSEIIPISGYPNFIYRDEMNRFKQEKWDKHNYYAKRSIVKVYSEGKTIDGVIVDVNFPYNTASIKIEHSIKEVDLDCLTRIL